MHGSRDNIYLNKFIYQKLREMYAKTQATKEGLKPETEGKNQVEIENLERKMVQNIIAGIARNYSGGEDSYRQFMKIFKKTLIDHQSNSNIEWGRHKTYIDEESYPNVLKLLLENVNDSKGQATTEINSSSAETKGDAAADPPRHVFIRTEGTFIDNYIVRLLSNEYKSTKVIYLPDVIRDEMDVEIIASKLQFWVKEGCILVLKDMDKLYSLLQEVLNMNYTTENKMQYSKIIYDRRERRVQIGRGFRCIVLQSLNRQPVAFDDGVASDETYAPFLNRLEKYYLPLRRMLNKKSYEDYVKIKMYMEGRTVNFSDGETLNKLDVLIHDYSADLLASKCFPELQLLNLDDLEQQGTAEELADGYSSPSENCLPDPELNQKIFYKFELHFSRYGILYFHE